MIITLSEMLGVTMTVFIAAVRKVILASDIKRRHGAVFVFAV